MLNLTSKEIELMKRLLQELELWPGAEETPHGMPLSEEDDETLWSIIEKIRSMEWKGEV